MNAAVLLTKPASVEVISSAGYLTGAIIALLILGYLLYSLVKPEKF
jgi:K+-transporting ATPase KdpF subunit